MIQVIILSIVLILLAVAGLGIKMIFDKKAEFKGSSCQAAADSEVLREKGISCGCEGACSDEK